jgi:hypothetical protein
MLLPDACFKTFCVLSAFVVESLTVPDFAAGVTFFAGSALAAVFGAGFAAALVAGLGVDFTPVLAGGLAGFATALLFAAVVFVFDGMTAFLAVALLALLAAVLFMADLVTVAFMVPSFPMNCPASRDSA